ncbi:hypothetical protein DSC45_29310 [Streptomyces sp. YIM 130001]|nr:hypothetical protein DSC45_29310 [Streptomyces sp. YIM 130001]
MSCYVPRLRVDLQSWCAWTGTNWDKVRAVTGHSFRMCGMHEDIYTMAANAVLRLITANGIDTRRIGFLALGTESSSDNAVGAVTVCGMVDRELRRRGLPGLPRDLEVPEYKHACLGGMYALTGAARYVQCESGDRTAIVVAADIAEYQRGSSGEQTQGAGAVAMLVERAPALLALDLAHATRSAAYRGPDFRKPVARHHTEGYAPATQRPSDFPVFSGRYSTSAYLDAVTHAVEALWRRLGSEPAEALRDLSGIFMHRPYQRMPLQALSFFYVRALAATHTEREELEELCAVAGVSPEAVVKELDSSPDLFGSVLAGERHPNPYRATVAVGTEVRRRTGFQEFAHTRLDRGAALLAQVGNLYSASLPAALAAGLETALDSGEELVGTSLLTVGYGSGDAALALPVSAVPGWQHAARRIGFARALRFPVDLDQATYEALHDRREVPGLQVQPLQEFVIECTGSEHGPGFQDLAVPYYAYEY